MRLEDQVKADLKNGSWVALDLKLRAERAIVKKLPGLLGGITEKSLAYYRKVDVRSERFPKGIREITIAWISECPRLKLAVENIVKESQPGAALSQFSPEEVCKIRLAYSTIAHVDQKTAQELGKSATAILKCNGVRFRSASHPHIMGLILLGPELFSNSTLEIAVSLIHELAHMELMLINMVNRLVNEEFDDHETFAPFQSRSRPPIARLHSLWALYRMVQFQKMAGLDVSRDMNLLKENAKAFSEGELNEMAEFLVELTMKVGA
jgi:hypothetical protein